MVVDYIHAYNYYRSTRGSPLTSHSPPLLVNMSSANALTILVLLPHLLSMYNTIRGVVDTRARLLEVQQRRVEIGTANVRSL